MGEPDEMRAALLFLLLALSTEALVLPTEHNQTNGTAPLSPDNLYCTACTEVVGEVQSKGCGLACSAIPPPGDVICEWMLSLTGLCQKIIKWLDQGLTPTAICKDMGFCGTACECGVCTQAGAGPDGRCLGAPNDCGHAAAAKPGFLFNPPGNPRSKFCLDGQCGDKGS